MTTRRLIASAIAIGLGLGACSDDGFDPITRITAPRVLALVSEPTALDVDGEVRVEAFTVDLLGPRDAARPVPSIRMRACTPWKLHADPSRDCLGADALELSPDAAGRFAMSTEALLAAFPPPMGSATPETLRAALAAGLELRIPVIADVEVDDERGDRIALVARRDLHVVESVRELENPRFAGLRFDGVATGVLRAGQRYQLTAAFDRESLDPSRDTDDDPAALEELDCNFYSPSGELARREVDVEELDVAVPETAPNAYTPGEPGPTWIYVVAADETGGMTFGAFPITVE